MQGRQGRWIDAARLALCFAPGPARRRFRIERSTFERHVCWVSDNRRHDAADLQRKSQKRRGRNASRWSGGWRAIRAARERSLQSATRARAVSGCRLSRVETPDLAMRSARSQKRGRSWWVDASWVGTVCADQLSQATRRVRCAGRLIRLLRGVYRMARRDRSRSSTSAHTHFPSPFSRHSRHAVGRHRLWRYGDATLTPGTVASLIAGKFPARTRVARCSGRVAARCRQSHGSISVGG